VKRAAVLLVIVLAIAGCGGGPADFTLQKTRACLKKNRTVRIGGKLDFVASTATGGALRARTPHNGVTLVLGATVEDADNINDAYHTFHAKNVGVEDILRQDRNAVLLFRHHPTDEDIATIENCLH
jgi:hypothetical protein